MKKLILLWFILENCIMGFASWHFVPKVEHLTALPSSVEMGIYDNLSKFEDIHTFAYEQLWCNWGIFVPKELLQQLQEVFWKGRTPILAVEPYAITGCGSQLTILPDIAAGKYDDVIRKLAGVVKKFGSTVYIRWGPEMDIPYKPWGGQPEADYIAAYRHFVTVFRKISPTSPQIWSPVGNDGCESYYPGDDVVDYTGYSLYELPAASVGWFGRKQSFADWMNQKYPAMAIIGKPIILPEIGICDTPENQDAWMRDAFAAAKDYPLLKIIVYFNSQDGVSWKKWGAKGTPNWNINSTVFLNPKQQQQLKSTETKIAHTIAHETYPNNINCLRP